jgi:WD40 repeat protein
MNSEVRQYVGHSFDTVACAFVPTAFSPRAPPLIATASKDCSIRIWHRDTGECVLCHSDATAGDSYSSLAVLPPTALDDAEHFVIVATTIRGLAYVYQVHLSEKRLECVARSAGTMGDGEFSAP